MSKVLRLLVLLLAIATPAAAQVAGPPFVFVAGTVINPDEVNSNFSAIYDAAVNRFGGTVEGHLLWSPDGTFDIGASGTSRPRDLFLQRDATIGGGITATALGLSGNATIGGTLGVTGASTLAAVSATTGTFSSTLGVSGASTLAAVSATTGTFSSTLRAAGVLTATAAGASLNIRPAGGQDGYLMWTEDLVADRWSIGIDDADAALKFRQGGATGTLVGEFNTGRMALTVPLIVGSSTFASLPVFVNGTIVYCSNCNRGVTPCTSGGAGALAVYTNSQWACL